MAWCHAAKLLSGLLLTNILGGNELIAQVVDFPYRVQEDHVSKDALLSA